MKGIVDKNHLKMKTINTGNTKKDKDYVSLLVVDDGINGLDSDVGIDGTMISLILLHATDPFPITFSPNPVTLYTIPLSTVTV